MKHAKIAFEHLQPGTPGERSSPRLKPMPGEGKADFRKITATLPQRVYQQLIQESARRKIAGEPNKLVSDMLREAVTDYLTKLAS